MICTVDCFQAPTLRTICFMASQAPDSASRAPRPRAAGSAQRSAHGVETEAPETIAQPLETQRWREHGSRCAAAAAALRPWRGRAHGCVMAGVRNGAAMSGRRSSVGSSRSSRACSSPDWQPCSRQHGALQHPMQCTCAMHACSALGMGSAMASPGPSLLCIQADV